MAIRKTAVPARWRQRAVLRRTASLSTFGPGRPAGSQVGSGLPIGRIDAERPPVRALGPTKAFDAPQQVAEVMPGEGHVGVEAERAFESRLGVVETIRRFPDQREIVPRVREIGFDIQRACKSRFRVGETRSAS